MQRFTYMGTGASLRNKVNTMIVVVSSDIIFWGGAGFLLKRPWNWVVLAGGLALTVWVIRFLRSQLHRVHILDEQALHLAFMRSRLRIERADVARVSVLGKPLAPDVDDAALSYRPQNDTIYMVASRRGLVALELTRPYEMKVPRKGICQFTRIVLTLDDPEAFAAALGAQQEAAAVADVAIARPIGSTPVFTAPLVDDGPVAIRLEGLVRRYGDFTAVDGLDLIVRPGEVLAFLGSNGAGKTTTIKMMTGLLRPSEGRVLILGRDLWAEGGEVRRLVGYVPDVPLLYDALTAREFLWLMAGLYGLDDTTGRQRADELLALVKLERHADQQIRSFSLGMKRKMAIAAALVHRPRVLLLDEVTNGLDPRAAREVKDFIGRAACDGVAVFLTTHILDVAEELAHRIAVIDGGRIRALGTLAELRRQTGLPDATLEQLFLALTGGAVAEEVGA